ncbi:MAG: tetratricopeptide repeat protein [Bryobacteraceae bacterium]|nr:tetratricopeptide repeat protein [Bryobacteraceae bacterium]
MFSRKPLLAAAGVALLALACTKKPAAETEPKAGLVRMAILPFDDQRGAQDGAWPARVLPVALARLHSSQPGVAARTANSAAEAVNSGATHIVHGRLVDAGSGARILLDLETVGQSRIEAAGSAPAGKGAWLKGVIESARLLVSMTPAKPMPLAGLGVASESSMERLGTALAGAEAQPNALAAAAAAEPGCGWCWEAWAESAVKGGNRTEAEAIFEKSRKASGLDETSRARLQLMESGIREDQTMRREALARLAKLTPSNIQVLSELAAVAVRSRRWSEAEKSYKRVLDLDPGSPDALNQLGYIAAWQGRFDEAEKWHRDYAASQPASANPEDSLGEVLLMAGRFESAEQAFAASFEKQPDFNSGAAMEKAALACWLRGDEAAARRRLDEFVKSRLDRGDVLVNWRRARWLYISGRTDDARAVMLELRGSAPPPVRAFAAGSLALWSAEAGDRGKAASYAAELVSNPHPVSKQILLIVQGILTSGSGQAGNPLAAGIASLLAGNDAAAVTHLKLALDAASPGSEGPARELLALALVRAGDVAAAARLIEAGWPIPDSIEGQLTDFMIYPNLFYVRARIAAHNKDAAAAARFYESYIRNMGSRPDPRRQREEALKAVRL